MGFRSIAINQKANEVFKVLGAAKAQYDKFGEQLAKARKNMEAASNAIAEADHRNSIIQKNLRSIESLDASESDNILGLTD
jgi:DNA recombination protein RmuC